MKASERMLCKKQRAGVLTMNERLFPPRSEASRREEEDKAGTERTARRKQVKPLKVYQTSAYFLSLEVEKNDNLAHVRCGHLLLALRLSLSFLNLAKARSTG